MGRRKGEYPRLKFVKLDNKSRKGEYVYVKLDTKARAAYFKKKDGLNLDDYITAYEGKIKNKRKGKLTWLWIIGGIILACALAVGIVGIFAPNFLHDLLQKAPEAVQAVNNTAQSSPPTPNG